MRASYAALKPVRGAAEYAISRPSGDHDNASTYCVGGVTICSAPGRSIRCTASRSARSAAPARTMNDLSPRRRSSSGVIESIVMNARLLPSGDHSYATIPSGAFVSCCGSPPETGIANTSGRPAAKPNTDTIVPSGDHRNCGRGDGVLKIRTVSPSRAGVPPPAGTTKSAASCSFLSRFGVDTT